MNFSPLQGKLAACIQEELDGSPQASHAWGMWAG